MRGLDKMWLIALTYPIVKIGIRRMIEDARKHKCPEPKFTVNGFFTATFWPNIEIVRKITGQVTEQVGEEVSEQVGTKLKSYITACKRSRC